MSIHWPIIKSCLREPGGIALVDDRRAMKRVELLVAAMHVADALSTKCRSRTVGCLTPTSAAFPIVALAAWMLGKVVVPLNFLLKKEELQYVIDDCETDTIVTVQPMLDYMGYTPKAANILKLEDLDFKSVPDIRWPASASDDDLAVLLYTSGTSGKPKGVMLSHGNITANIDQACEFARFTRNDKLLGVLPQFHSFGMTVLTLLPLSRSIPVVYTARFVPHKIIQLIREHRPTFLVAIPSMYNALLHVKDASPEDFTSLRYIVSGGEPLPDAVASSFKERFGVAINEGYGLTETAPVTNWCTPEEYRPHSVGRTLPRIDQRIMDPATGAWLPPGHDGEVLIKGPNVMQGYFKLPEETAKALDSRGYLHTGDMGRFDSDGHLYITGRIKEMLIIGGENVFPREIEEVLNRHPAVNASGVVGKRDPMRGELPVAFVEFKEGQTATERELQMWCRQSLAGYKVPDEVRALAALPRNPTGKIMRRELKGMVTPA